MWTVLEIHRFIEDLKVYHRNTNISRIVALTICTAGNAMSIVGMTILPSVTFRVSLALTIGGTALAVVGGVTDVGVQIGGTTFQLVNIKTIQRLIAHDYHQLNEICKIHEAIQKRTGNGNALSGIAAACRAVVNERIEIARISIRESQTKTIRYLNDIVVQLEQQMEAIRQLHVALVQEAQSRH